MIDRYGHLAGCSPHHLAIRVPPPTVEGLALSWGGAAALESVRDGCDARAGCQVTGLDAGLGLRQGIGSARRWAPRRNCEARNAES
jgi:hypothetical protein